MEKAGGNEAIEGGRQTVATSPLRLVCQVVEIRLGGFFVLWLAAEVLRVYVKNCRDMGFADRSD